MLPPKLLYQLQMLKYRGHPPNTPSNVFIEVTNRCGYSCVMCPRTKMTRERGDMSVETFEQVINQMVEAKIKKANLYLYGEPTLNRNLIEMIGYAKEKGIHTTIDITGFNLTDTYSRLLIGSGVDRIFFSIHGTTPETYLAAHGVNGFEKVKTNLEHLIGLKKEMLSSTPTVTVQCTYMETNKDVYKNIQTVFGDEIDYRFTTCTFNPHTNTNDLRVDKSEYTRSIPCTEIYTSLAVSWNGDITVCCNDVNFELILGNIFTDTLKSAFNSPKLQLLRDTLKACKNIPILCKGCIDPITSSKRR